MGHDEPLLADVEEGHHKNAADSAGEAERAIVAQVCIRIQFIVIYGRMNEIVEDFLSLVEIIEVSY